MLKLLLLMCIIASATCTNKTNEQKMEDEQNEFLFRRLQMIGTEYLKLQSEIKSNQKQKDDIKEIMKAGPPTNEKQALELRTEWETLMQSHIKTITRMAAVEVEREKLKHQLSANERLHDQKKKKSTVQKPNAQ